MPKRAWKSFQSLLFLLAILCVWEAATTFFAVSPFVLPAPSMIAKRLYQLVVSGIIWPHFIATLTSILTGLLIGVFAGLLCGSLISLVPLFERFIYPYLVAIQTIPKVAIAPLLIVWFGYGLMSKVVITAMLSFFPMLISSIAGFKAVDREQIEMMKAFGATPMQTMFHLRLHAALVPIFAGLEIASILAVIGAIVGEFVGAQVGLGYLIASLNFNLDIAGMFAVLIFLSAIGLTLHALVKLARSRFVFWIRYEAVPVVG